MSSVDPNALTGPAGYGSQHHVPRESVLAYRIDFENDASASVPAQQVDITNQLDPSLDWAGFELTEIGFGDTFIAVPPGRSTYSATLSMTFENMTFDVQVQAGIDPATGKVSAHFYSIDPAWGTPPPVNIGFLPPEDGSGRGMGHIAYIVRPVDNLTEGTEIRNIALIVFDMGEQIYTNQVDPHDPAQGTDPEKEALVTLDTGTPASGIDLVEQQDDGTCIVSWSGSDSGSGIAGYDVYVRNPPSLAWGLWLENTPAQSAVFSGTGGETYEFYTVGMDNVGYRETKDPVPEAAITVTAAENGDTDPSAATVDPPVDTGPAGSGSSGKGSPKTPIWAGTPVVNGTAVTQIFEAAGEDKGKLGTLYLFTPDQYYDGYAWSPAETAYLTQTILGTHTITYDTAGLVPGSDIFIGYGTGFSDTATRMQQNGTFVTAYTTVAETGTGTDQGQGQGQCSITCNLDDDIELYLTTTNDDGYSGTDLPYEWLVFGATVGGVDKGLFFFTNAMDVVAYAPSLDLTTVTYTFDHSQGAFKVTDLNLGALGLSKGDSFWYGYVYGLEGFDLADDTTWSLENFTIITAQ